LLAVIDAKEESVVVQLLQMQVEANSYAPTVDRQETRLSEYETAVDYF